MYEDFIPERLTQLRIKKNISAREMSLKIGQSENYINMIENKRSFPSMQTFLYICDYLGITPGQFFDGDNTNPMLLDQVTNTLKRVDDDTLTHIFALAEKLAR